MKKFILLLASTAVFSFNAKSQGYDIKINFKGCKDTMAYLVKYTFDQQYISDTCKKINKLESKADSVFDKAVADIFENETDAKNVIKYKEVLSALEMASDKCKSVSNVMEQISVKHS